MKEYSCKLIDSLAVGNTLGEGIIWNKEDGAVWWTDIQESTLYRYHLASKEIQTWSMPERVACFAFVDNGEAGGTGRLIVAFASGLAYYDLETGAVELLAKPEEDSPGNRFNDGRVDRQGRFWAGTMVEDEARSTRLAALYRLDGKNRFDAKNQFDAKTNLSQVEQGITISNGLCWSPGSKWMYHADSPSNKMYVYDFDAKSGVAGNRRLFAETDPGCYPDGATVDSEGYLFSAQWGGSRLVRYSPEGKVEGVLNVPVTQPTCMTFGGENLDILFISTAREGLSAEALERQPQAGNVLIYQTDFKGIEDPFFKVRGSE